MVYSLTKILDYGTTHPICARIGCGLGDIVRMVDLSDEEKNNLNFILHSLMKDLITTEKHAIELCTELDEIEKRIKLQSKETAPNTFESSLKLNLCRDFLKYANNSIRLLTGFFDICLKIGNKQTKLQNVISSIDTLDPTPKALHQHLTDTNPWFKKIVDLRGRDEHKAPHKDFVYNYSIGSNEKFSYLKRPAFFDGTDVHLFLKYSLDHLLPIFELSLVFTLSYCLPDPMVIVEIPKKERDPELPRRFRLDLA